MPQVTSLVKTLKSQLKAHGKTYADVAELLTLSEASVKRIFAEESFTIQRLEEICQMIELEISDLVQIMANNQKNIVQLHRSQEEEIASDVLLLMVTACVINGYSFDEIVDNYAISETTLIQKLALLDRLKIIELLPNNRIKRLIAPNFSWLPNGPIQKFFMEKIEKDFFNSNFSGEKEKLIVLNGLLCEANNVEIQNKMQKLANGFSELTQLDQAMPVKDKGGVTLVLALREWDYSIFNQYQKNS